MLTAASALTCCSNRSFPLTALFWLAKHCALQTRNTGRKHFDWLFATEDGRPARATNGMWLHADCSLGEMPAAEVYLLFQGNLPTQHNTKRLLAQLRSAARHGGIVGGVDTGVFALAESGVVRTGEHDEVVLHWEAVPTFREHFPSCAALEQIYMIKGREVFCAGGVATLDMMLDLISRFRGQALANEVADALVHTRRSESMPQRGGGIPDSDKITPIQSLVRLMEKNLEEPLNVRELARGIGVSERTLYRICKKEFGQPPSQLYKSVRLQAARNLLFYDEFSIGEVAIACGFSYPEVFSRSFKKKFGRNPRNFRKSLRKQQYLTFRPELRSVLESK